MHMVPTMARITSAPAGNALEMSRGTESRTFRTMSVMTLKNAYVFLVMVMMMVITLMID